MPLLINEAAPPYKYGSSQLEFGPICTRKLQLPLHVANIENVGPGGLESDTHLTIRYGINEFEPGRMRTMLSDEEPVICTVTGIECFPDTKDGACIHFTVAVTPELLKLRKLIEDNADCIEPTFPVYKPHITIGYFKKDKWESEAARFKELYEFPFHITADNLMVSEKTGQQYNHPLAKNHAEHKLAQLVKDRLRAPQG